MSGEPATRLGRVRVSREISQATLASITGISLRTIQRLEQGAIGNPPIRYLTQCAIALEVELDEIIEPEWRAWSVFDLRRPQPPKPGWWRQPYQHVRWKYSPYARAASGGQSEPGGGTAATGGESDTAASQDVPE